MCAGYGSPAGALLVCVSYMGLSLKESPVGGRLAPRGGTTRPDERNFISFVGGCVLCVGGCGWHWAVLTGYLEGLGSGD